MSDILVVTVMSFDFITIRTYLSKRVNMLETAQHGRYHCKYQNKISVQEIGTDGSVITKCMPYNFKTLTQLSFPVNYT